MKRELRRQAAKRKMRFESPLLTRLQELAKKASKQFRYTLHGFDNIGLNVGDGAPTGSGCYHCSPSNSKCFASTGGEGVHFSFLAEQSECNFDDLPVVVTIPMAFGNSNFIVGENLHDFLSLGCHRGFFALEQLGHQTDKTLDVYSDPHWQAQTNDEFWVGFGVDELKSRVLTLLRKELRLVQWTNLKTKFFNLQERYMPVLQIPDAE